MSLREQRRPVRARSPSIATGVALLELDLDAARLGRARRADRACAGTSSRIGLPPRILEHAALVARVQEVAIDRVRLVGRRLDRDRVLSSYTRSARVRPVKLPLAPRRDDLDRRIEVVRGELEAHLIVALAGRAVRDRVGALGVATASIMPAAMHGPRERRAEQVLAFVQRVGAQRGEHVVARRTRRAGRATTAFFAPTASAFWRAASRSSSWPTSAQKQMTSQP